MKIYELSSYKDVLSNFKLEGEELFIYRHGSFNCKRLIFRDANTVIKLMDEYDPNALETEDKKFILSNSNKEVLCYICHSWEDNPSIFVYGDDNIAFQTDCFI